MKMVSQLPYILTWDDLYLSPLYLLIIFFVVRIWKKRNYSDSPLRKYIYPALLLRMLGCIFLALILNFYYEYGDSFSYFTGAHEIWTAFVHNPKTAAEIIFNDPKNYSQDALDYAIHSGYPYFAFSYYAMFRIAGVIGLFCFGSYMPIALIFALLSFWGTWMILLVFNEEFPQLRKYIAISTLFIPSVIIWTTGIMKEPICMFGLGTCFYTFNNILKRRHVVKNIIFFSIGSMILIFVKDYIFYIFLIGTVVWGYKSFIKHLTLLPRIVIKSIIYLAFLFILINFLFTDSNFIETAFTRYFSQAEHLQTVMTSININYNSGSGYTLPTDDVSSFGLVKGFFLAMNVSLFRPYLWECSNFLMVLNALESLATLIVVVGVLIRTRVINIYRELRNPLLLFSAIFSLLMAALVGYVSFNFGTLIRYKAPFEPFFFTLLLILLFSKHRSKNAGVIGNS